MIQRALSSKLKKLIKGFPVVAILGPRQSGKTTLARSVFSTFQYSSLEDPSVREFATNDPRAYLSNFTNGVIIDEAQRVPELFSYIQGIVDANKKARFVLTGSQNFLLHERITQSLAGRVALTTLLPFSMDELKASRRRPKTIADMMLKGFYPPLYDKSVQANDWYSSYISTYIERDVRLVRNIGDLRAFSLFLQLCAGRTGQMLNLSALAASVGINHNTAASWLSVLEASYVVFMLRPHHVNYNKRLVKLPKLYFYDVGLASSLLGIRSLSEMQTHYAYGALFENYVIAEVMKAYHHRGEIPRCYYWRDNVGHEIDLLVEQAKTTTIVEIKSGQTIQTEFFNGLEYYQKLSQQKLRKILVTGTQESHTRSNAEVLGWSECGTAIVDKN